MLVAQAARAAELFVGKRVPPERVETIFNDLERKKENVVLIGMPGSGKTSVGKRLAQMLGCDLIDTDALVVEQTKCSIPELFQKVGEKGFRDAESEAIRAVSAMQSVVIATGGGAVLRHQNMAYLRENGRVYFLDRSLSLLTATEDRPLSSTAAALRTRYEERYPIYCKMCDVRLSADGTVEEVANLIREDFLNENFSA